MTAVAHAGALEVSAPEPGRAPGSFLQLGISTSPVCGVRDYGGVLERSLRAAGLDVRTAWCDAYFCDGVGPGLRRVRSWLDGVRQQVEEAVPDVVLLEYSAWGFGPRGIPLAAPLVAGELERLGVPVLGILHELAYPFGRRGWRGALQAVTQRTALRPVIAACDALVVTTEDRSAWLSSRRWLPRRPVSFVPVPSNFPPVPPEPRPDTGVAVGVFGFGSPHAAVDVVAAGVARLRERLPGVRLTLIGAPGGESPAAQLWCAALAARGVGDGVEFTGVGEPHEIARALARADVLVFADESGPASRRGTLAAALGAGRPLVALDGPERWQRLAAESGAIVVPPTAEGLGSALVALAEDPALRAAQARRAANFYARVMAPAVVAERVVEAAASTVARSSRGRS